MRQLARQRTSPAGLQEARSRLRSAQAYLEVADLVLDEHDRREFLNVDTVRWAKQLVERAEQEVER